jgi:hypothetical protein
MMERIEFIIAIILVLWNRLLIFLAVRKPRDGWRRGAGIALRGEESTFVLAAFGLQANEEVLRARLVRLLDREPVYHTFIQIGEFEDHPVSHSSASFTLRFENGRDGMDRFVRPDSWNGVLYGTEKDNTNSRCLLNFVARTSAIETSDLWMRVNHVGLDGVLAQQLLTKLESELGKVEVLYPSFHQFQAVAVPRIVEGRPSAIEIQLFVDLRPLMEWRRRQSLQLRENMTLSAAVLWWLAMHDSFRALNMGTTVDLAADGNSGRGVGVVVIRPGDFINKPDGLARFVRTFNRQLERTRQRQSDSVKTLNAAAAIPARLERLVLRSALKSTRAFGSLGLTMLRDASVFGAPIAEVGHDHGFIAIGSALLPTEGGEKVACITVKGEKGIIDNYPVQLHEALHEAVANSIVTRRVREEA